MESIITQSLHCVFLCLIYFVKSPTLFLTLTSRISISQQTVENSERDGNTRPPYLPSEKPVCRSSSQQLGPDLEQQTGSKLEKGCIHQGCTLSPCLLSLYAEYILRNARLMKCKLRLPKEISITSDTQMKPSLWQKVKRN